MFMNPGDGQDHITFEKMNIPSKSYDDTGISIIVKRKT
jgi:hypothetical protein